MSEFIDKEPAKASPASSAVSASSVSRSAAPVITGGGGLVHYATSAPDPQSSTLLKSQMHFATTRDIGTFQHQRRTVTTGSSLLSSSNVELSCGGRTSGGGGTMQQHPTAATPGGRGLDNAGVDRSPVHCSASSTVGGSVVISGAGVENDVREIRRMLKAYISRMENKDAAAKTTKEWRIVARVLDRLFFFCYIGTILVSLFTVFPHETDETYVGTNYIANEPLTTEIPDSSDV
jgi:hypothetical protein